MIYITKTGTNENIEEFINYYLNLGFDNIYIYEIINDISKYDRKLKNIYPNVKIYIIPESISYSNNNYIETEIINNYEANIFTKNGSTHYLYMDNNNELEIKNYLSSNNYTNICNYINNNNNNITNKRILMTKM